jgi:hypothetical protein
MDERGHIEQHQALAQRAHAAPSTPVEAPMIAAGFCFPGMSRCLQSPTVEGGLAQSAGDAEDSAIGHVDAPRSCVWRDMADGLSSTGNRQIYFAQNCRSSRNDFHQTRVFPEQFERAQSISGLSQTR